MLQFTGYPGTGFGVVVLEALQLPQSAPSPLLLTIPLPGGQSMPVGGSQVLSRWRPRRQSFHFHFFHFFLNHALYVSRYKKPYAVLAMKRKKPINANPPPASPLHGKNQTPGLHRKSPPRLAPKIIYPRRVRKQCIETYR